MKSAIQERTGMEAAQELMKLRGRFAQRPRGTRKLTLKMIMEQTGVKAPATVSLWNPESENHHEPQGATLMALNKFLDRCRDKAWLEKLINKKKGSK